MSTRPRSGAKNRLVVKTGSKAGWESEQHNARRIVVKTAAHAGSGHVHPQHTGRRLSTGHTART